MPPADTSSRSSASHESWRIYVMEIMEIMCDIYLKHPKECPIEVILIVFMYEHIEYGG